jgi:hypothetical protein
MWLLSFGALVALVGCSATGPAFRELVDVPKDKATVYVYRPTSLVNSGNAPNLFVNEVDNGPLWNAGYIPLSLPPGQTSLVLKGTALKWGLPPIAATVQIEAGKTYYFRMGNQIDSTEYGGRARSFERTIQIQQVPADYGQREIVGTKLVGEGGR